MSEIYQKLHLDPSTLIRRAAMLASVVSLGSAFTPDSAEGKQPKVLPSAEAVPVCPLNMLSGPNTNCETANVPVSCVQPDTWSQMRHFKFDPAEKEEGVEVVNQVSIPGLDEGVRPDLELGFQDDAGVVAGDKRADAILLLGKVMGAKIFRVVVYPYRWPDPRERKKIDQAVNSATGCGYEVQMTLALSEWDWTRKRAARYAAQVATRYKGRVHRYEMGNEPNHESKKYDWLRSMPRRTDAETYGIVYESGYEAIKKVDETNQVYWGSLSPQKSMRFFRKVVAACESADKTCELPIKMDAFAYHPYIDIKEDATELPPLYDPTKTVNSITLGFEGVHVVEAEIDRAHADQTIATPEGDKPKVFLNEFSTHRYELTEEQRAQLHVKILDRVCPDPQIGQLIYYQFAHARGSWNTGVVDPKGTIRSPYYAVSEWVKRNPGCLVDSASTSLITDQVQPIQAATTVNPVPAP